MSDTDIPDSVTYREIQEILRTFRDSSWRSIALDLHGMRITVGKDGPPAHDQRSGPDGGGFPPGTGHDGRSWGAADGSAPAGPADGAIGAPAGRTSEDQHVGPDQGGIRPSYGHNRRSSTTAAAPGQAAAAGSAGGTSAGSAPAGSTSAGGASAGSATAGGVAIGSAGAGSSAPGGVTPPGAVDTTGCVEVRSPAVGAFWIAPSPGQSPFVEIGQTVAQDEQLAIVEVMKLMNPVVAPVAGEVVAVNAANADLVEYEQVLFWIRPGG